MSEDDPTLQVARDLREIVDLSALLLAEAVNDAGDIEMPGGLAMVMLGPVASPEAWANILDGVERWNASDYRVDHDLPERDVLIDGDEWEPPLQTLLFWSEQWRYEHDAVIDHPTLSSEAQWLARSLRWALDHEPHWSEFCRDIRTARRRLEAELREGVRRTVGVRCPQCKARSLVRHEDDRRHRHRCHGHGHLKTCPLPRQGCCDEGGLGDHWYCELCFNRLDEAEYREAVARAWVANAPWLPAEYVERRTGVRAGTVRAWASRGHVQTKTAWDGRTVYRISDIEARLAKGDDAA